jgi:adenylate cyclase
LYAALDMQAAVKKLHAEFAAQNWPEINFGIGINTGEMSVGDMGSKFRRNYTVLGDAVNLASRVEELTKYYGIKIIVTESIQKNQTLFIFRQLDRVRVPGKKTAVAIYELVCRQSDASKELLQEITLSEKALSHYFNQEWQEARDIFTALLQAHPHHPFYQLYLNRILEFETTPPAPNWDGVSAYNMK